MTPIFIKRTTLEALLWHLAAFADPQVEARASFMRAVRKVAQRPRARPGELVTLAARYDVPLGSVAQYLHRFRRGTLGARWSFLAGSPQSARRTPEELKRRAAP